MEKYKYNGNVKAVLNAIQAVVNPTAIVEYYYQGVTGGTPCETYAADTLYLCVDFLINETSNQVLNLGNNITFYNEANAAFFSLQNNRPAYDTTAAAFRYGLPFIKAGFFWFSRFNTSYYDHYRFIGYQITY